MTNSNTSQQPVPSQNTTDGAVLSDAHGTPLLTAQHRAMLVDDRAIAEALVTQRGYQTLPQPEDLADRRFSKAQAKTAPALGIPLWDVHGQQHGWQIRPDCPRQLASGKVFKYEMPKGDHLLLDVHPSVQPLLGDPREPLWITEGVPKGDALASQGLCTLALIGGVWGFRGTNEHGGKVILPDWDYVALNGREVYVVFDSDLHTKPHVQKALKALYTLLRSKGAIPALAQWPETFQQRKWGVDDFFAAGHTLAELRAMFPPQGPLPQVPPSPSRSGIVFDLTRGGEVRVALLNLLYVFEQDPAWTDALGFNLLLNDVILLQRPPYLQAPEPWVPRPVTEHDWAETANWMQRTYHLYVSSAMAGEGLTTYGARFPFHPIRDYLGALTWDGTKRLDTWLTTYCHVAETPYSRAVASKTLIAAVARILSPGCKVDTMTILEGEQGLYKSMAWRTLAGDAWFTDNLPDLHDKDAAQTLLGKWFVELAELSQFQRSEIETVKSFLSRQSDHYRPSYGRRAATFPRQQLFVGTTNAEHYFKDRTGNRRYWPVTVEAPCDLTALQRDRDQLWAEAVVRYQAGEAWYMNAALEQLARVEQDSRLEPDDWEAPVLTYAETCYHIASGGALQYVTSLEVLTHGLNFENPLLHTMGNTKRVASILRANRWKTAPVRDTPNGKQFKAFTRPNPPPKDADTTQLVADDDFRPELIAVTAVTADPLSNTGSGNRVFPNNNAPVTAVTAVTASIYTQGEEKEKHDICDKRSFTVLEYSIASIGSSGNNGNSGNSLLLQGEAPSSLAVTTGNSGNSLLPPCPPVEDPAPPLVETKGSKGSSVPEVGDQVWLLLADGVISNHEPYTLTAIVQAENGPAYAMCAEMAGGWPLAQCERVALAEGEDTGDDAGDDDEPWPDAPEAPLTPDEQFDEIEAMYQQRAEEVPAPSLKGVATMTEACEKSEESPLAQLPATDCAPSPCPHAETVRDPLPMLDGSFVVRCVACKRPVATTSPERS